MGDDRALDQLGQKHYRVCRLLFYCFFAFLLFRAAMGVAAVLWTAATPASQLELTDTGSAYRYTLFHTGIYSQLGYDSFPHDLPLEDPKLFCVALPLLTLVSEVLPMLALMECGRRLLRLLGKAPSPFVPEAAVWIRRMGCVLILMGLFGKLVLQAGMGAVAYHAFYAQNPVQFPPILAGCVLLLLSDIFRRGCQLQRDSDETL